MLQQTFWTPFLIAVVPFPPESGGVPRRLQGFRQQSFAEMNVIFATVHPGHSHPKVVTTGEQRGGIQ